jgi:sugar lactone lactonase YvrE
MSGTGTKSKHITTTQASHGTVLRRWRFFMALVGAILCCAPALIAQTAKPVIAPNYGNLPLSFTANQGQADKSVKFLTRGQGYDLYLTANEAVLALSKPVPRADRARMQEIAHLRRLWPFLNAAQRRRLAKMSASLPGTDTLRMELKGANRQAQVSGSDELPGTTNYFLGNDATRWLTHLATFAKVHYTGVYPGIDLIYYGNQRRLEYDFVVAPHANPRQVELHFSGAQQLRLDDLGNLHILGNNGEVAFEKPVVYQDDKGQRVPVEGRYALLKNHTVGFKVGKYDRSKALIIDPTLSYSTYIGGSTEDAGTAIAVDSSGNIYIIGFTLDADFPVTTGALQTTNTVDNAVAFVAKLNAAGSALVYATYLGGIASSGNESVNDSEAFGLAVDATGSAYITGETFANDFPVTAGAFQTMNNGYANTAENAFISKLSADGTALAYSTYLGGSGLAISFDDVDFFEGDSPLRMTVDTAGSAYVVGTAYSTDFPTTSGAYQLSNKAAANFASNAFVAKLSPNGSSLVYSTYLGGSGVSPSSLPNDDGEGRSEAGYGIAVDTAGEAYVSGYTFSANFPVTANSYQQVNHGTANLAANAFVSKLNATGTGLAGSTYLGGTGRTIGGNGDLDIFDNGDDGLGVALDASGNAYVIGITSSTDFPTSTGAYQTTNNAAANLGTNVFVSKLDPTLSTLMYSTYIGGSGIASTAGASGGVGDFGTGIAIDTAGNAYITGATESRDFPVTSDAFQSGPRNAQVVDSGFFTEVNSNGSALQYSTYLGGSGAGAYGGTEYSYFEGDFFYDIALDGAANAYLTGYAYSYDFPVTKNALQTVNNAGGGPGGNSFIAKFGATAGETFLPTTTTLTSAPGATSVTFTAVVKGTPAAGVPTGTVNFYLNSVREATVTLDETGTATYTSPLLADLTDVIAAYSGNAIYGASGISLGQIPSSPPPGTATQLVFIVPPASPIAPGGNGGTAVVTVEDGDGNPVTTASVPVTVTITGPTGYTSQTDITTSADGIATFNFANYPLTILGTYTYTATSPNLISATAFETVTSATSLIPTTLALAATPAGSSFAGQPVTLTATLSPFSTGSFTTNGETVTFQSNGATIGTGILAGGVATLITNALPAGGDLLTAAYPADANFQGSTSNSFYYAVYPLSASTTTLAVTSGGNAVTTVTAGSVVTLTATVDADGTVTQGQIIFCDATAARCENSAVLGTAQLTTAATATLRFVPGIGSHNYKAIFAGTLSIATSTSAAQPLTVTGLYPTATTIAAAGAPGNYTLTGTVVGTGNPSLSPAGAVSFVDTTNGNASLGTATLGGGIAAQTFVAASGSPVTAGVAPYTVASGDFDGDGFTDLAVVNYDADTVSVFIGNGDGTFKPQVNYTVGTEPEHIVAADVNNDGKLDLVVANTGSGNVGVLLGNGDGTFQAQVTYTTIFGSSGLIVADFNHDGNLDIAASNFYSADVSILLGNGDGTFQAQVTYAVGNGPRKLASGDFNGDGNIDLAVGNEQDSTISILLGNGAGAFQTQLTYPTGNAPEGLAVADFNGDGVLDLAVANSGGGTVGILLGNSNGTFQAMTTYAVGNDPVSPVVADFNGDGKADLAVENFNDGTESVLLGNGDGTLGAQTTFQTGTNPYAAAIGDFNGDGLPDLVISNIGSDNETVLIDQITSTESAILANVSVTGAPGNHNVVANYPGDTNFATSTSPSVILVPQTPLSTPTITSLSPNAAYAGSGDTVVTITGTNFVRGAAVTVNGTSQAATFVSATQLTTTLTAAELSTVGTLTLAVINPDGGASNAAVFTVVAPPLQVTPATLSFGSQTVGTQSPAQVVTLTNTSTTAYEITGIILDLGVNPSDFLQTNNCPGTLAGGANCQISITFAPAGIGAKSAGLLISDNSPAPMLQVALSGTGAGGVLQVNPGNLKTIAGNGTAGHSGDGGPATTAELNTPDGIAFDTQGNLYIADISNNVIRKVDTLGNITTVAGNATQGFSGDGGPATAAELNGPFGVVLDAAGNLYIMDALNARIRKVDTAGTITTFAGNGKFGFAGDGGPATSATISLVQGARFDTAGNLYVPQCGPAAVRKIDTSGTITTVAGNGTDGFSGDGGPATAAQLNCPSGVVIDNTGDLFIADYNNDRIREVNASGVITTIAGNGTSGFSGDGGPSLTAEVNIPNDVDLDSAGNLYIADSGNNRVRKIDTTGIITTVVGGLNNAGSAGINAPSALAFDLKDNLYFSDTGNNAIREVFPAGALVFPATPVATSAAPLTVTLSNIGNVPVTIASQASFGFSGNTTDFSLVGGTCLQGATLAANGGNCTLEIGFTPTATGTRTLTVSITDNAVYSPQSFQIGGTGTTAGAVVLNTISPTGVSAGAGNTTITASGANFTPTSVVNFNAAPLATTFVSASQLMAVVPAALLTTAGAVTITVTDASSDSTSQAQTFTIAPAVAVTFSGPSTSNPGQQPTLNFTLSQAYPVPLNVAMTMTFAPAGSNPDNPQVQFATGGRTFGFTLAANTTATPIIQVQTGTVAGTITVSLQLTANGINVTPSSVAPITIVVLAVAPTISNLSFTTSGDTLTVLVTGYSNTREIQSATFNFTPASGATLAMTTIIVPATTMFLTWYSSSDSVAYGSTFTYTQNFLLSGSATVVGGVGVTLTNTVGPSQEATSP